MPNRDWSELPEGAKNHYRSEGVTAGTYNAWWRMSQTDRTNLSVEAKASGYESGLRFMAIRAQVKRSTGRTITPRTAPREAARQIVRGKKGAEGKRQRKLVSRLFDFSEFDRLEWVEFMSP